MGSNVDLFDSLTKHQLFLDKLKYGQAESFNDVIEAISLLIVSSFGKYRYDTLDELSKRQLNSLLRSVLDSSKKIYSAYSKDVISKLKAFIGEDLPIIASVFESSFPYSLEQQAENTQGFSFVPFAFLGETDESNDKLFKFINGELLPANGMFPSDFLAHFTSSAIMTTLNEIRKGYSNKEKFSVVQDRILGNQTRRGLTSKHKRQSNYVMGTLFQHTSTLIQASVGSFYTKRYVWNSVIDSVTTDICKGRNGSIYTFGKGPLPPAHGNCRSGILPFEGTLDGKTIGLINLNYKDWLEKQPAVIKSQFDTKANKNSSLTLDEFASKRKLILPQN